LLLVFLYEVLKDFIKPLETWPNIRNLLPICNELPKLDIVGPNET